MNLLALETSGFQGSIAAFVDATLSAEMRLADDCGSAKSLAPAVRQLLAKVNWTPQQIDLIAVTTGPGSFTGLRVGVTTAKILAYAAAAKVVGINTLDAIAAQVPPDLVQGDLYAVMDAQRKQLFTATYRWVDGAWRPIIPAGIVDRAAWMGQLRGTCTVTGPGLSRCDEQAVDARIVSSEFWQPRAETVGRLAGERSDNGETDDLWTLSPQYFRQSAAEEKASETA